MTSNFLISALNEDLFSDYFNMSDSELKLVGAYIFNADESPCYPCRVSLVDAEVGEDVLALSFEHHTAKGPYASTGPIFVRKNAKTKKHEKNEIPEMLRHRLLSIRGYSGKGLMIEADTVNGEELESTLSDQFKNGMVHYIHIHNAGPGCFNCLATRV